MVKVYRIELGYSTLNTKSKKNMLSTQQGPYTTYDSWMSTANGYSVLHCTGNISRTPEPHEDGLESRFSVIYGFKDIAQMYVWFESDLLTLNESGFQLSIYEIPEEEVEYGFRQVQFDPCYAKLVSVQNILDAVNEVYDNDDFIDSVLSYLKGL